MELIGETGFNSSPKTRGVLVRAKKSLPRRKHEAPAETAPGPAEASHEAVLAKALELGAEKVKIIDTRTVVVEKWVRWKCLYGCPMYDHDAYHPPAAPDAEETRQMLAEYSRAVLLCGPKGRQLTDIAVRLEGEAYRMGYYKAFAMTALASGSDSPEPDSGAT